MRLPKFEHLQPSSREEVSRLLQEHGSRARLVAGGTDIYPRMKYGLARPDVLISLSGLTTTPPFVDPNGDLHVDALMTLSDLARSRAVLEKAPFRSRFKRGFKSDPSHGNFRRESLPGESLLLLQSNAYIPVC